MSTDEKPREFIIIPSPNVILSNRRHEAYDMEQWRECEDAIIDHAPREYDARLHLVEKYSLEAALADMEKLVEVLQVIKNETPNVDVPIGLRYHALADWIREHAEEALEQHKAKYNS